MKTLNIQFGLFSLLAVLAASVFLTSCEQDTTEIVSTEYEEFDVKGSYIIYAPEDAFSLEELINLEDATARQNFVDNLNSQYELETEMDISSRYCSAWTSWQPSGYTCEKVRWRYCGHSGYYAQAYQFKCDCSAYPACP